MAPRSRDVVQDVTQTELDFEDHQGAPVINRTVAKVTKKRATTAKAPTVSKRVPTKTTKAQREALKDRTNIKDTSDTEEVEEFDDEQAPTKVKSKKGRAVPRDQEEVEVPAKKRVRAIKAQPAAEDEQLAPKPSSNARKAASHKRAPSVEQMRIIPETQPMQDISETIEASEQMDVDEQPAERHTSRVIERARSASAQRQLQSHGVPPRARSVSQQPRHFSRERSSSDAGRRVGDGETRRKLADVTDKYENLRLQYENLQELGRGGAETNFEKLKRATDQRAKDANDLIASLKKELSEVRKSTSSSSTENARLHTQISQLQSSNETLQTTSKGLQTALSDSQNEVKALTAKLEAARKSVTAVAEAAQKVPGSAVKARNDTSKLSSGNLDATKTAALKEELYRDLTGLIINSIKRKEGEDEYSCIQTGRNGTLHFHLSISTSQQANPKTPSGLSYEDAEFAYEPFFDEGRDRDLIDILPDYLTEEICFPRSHAVKFYTKVVDSMTKRVVVEE